VETCAELDVSGGLRDRMVRVIALSTHLKVNLVVPPAPRILMVNLRLTNGVWLITRS
jgi:hypothetical protein